MQGLSQGLTYKVRGYFATTLPRPHHYHRHTRHFWGHHCHHIRSIQKWQNLEYDMENKDDIPLLSLKYYQKLKLNMK